MFRPVDLSPGMLVFRQYFRQNLRFRINSTSINGNTIAKSRKWASDANEEAFARFSSGCTELLTSRLAWLNCLVTPQPQFFRFALVGLGASARLSPRDVMC
jgi:hypothetical protein